MVLMLQLECGTKIFFFSILLVFLSVKKRGSTEENVVATRAHLPNCSELAPDDTTKGQIQILQGTQPTTLYSGNAYFRPRHQLH